MPKKKNQLRTYALYWEATVRGVQTVEAFDEEDAREQFNPFPNICDLDDEPMHADLDDCIEVKPKKGKK